MQEGNLSISLQGRDMDIFQTGQGLWESCQLMVMGRKQGLSTGTIVDIFDDGLGKSHSIIGRSSPSQLIK